MSERIKMSKKFNALSREEQIKAIMNMNETNYTDFEDEEDDDEFWCEEGD
ncbi:unnamed protein product [marine sediment metagenome]|uniref:Uncharacterized protein n=1 Tax=marine sediment metagenome TaxID=412755 RepID=X1FUP7_9ZZZZ